MECLTVADTFKSENPDGEIAQEPERSLLFISHANPQDNAAAAWFATQLTLLGYDVWCNLTNSHGGESAFWLKVQKKIEEDAAKVIFILSDSSRDFEKKRGVYKEVQAADSVDRDNFILPLRIEKLTGKVPILIGTDTYINSENWMAGLGELRERLEHDNVPKVDVPDLEKISSWWPAIGAKQALVRDEGGDLVSNVFSFKALPERIHFLKVSSESNPLTGRKRLRKVLPEHPAHATHSDYAISFARGHDFLELTNSLDIEDAIVLPTADFLRYGHAPLNIAQQAACNIVTYLVASAFEKYLSDRGLRSKSAGRSPRKIWYPAYGLIEGNRHSISEPGLRKAPVSFVGIVSSYRRKYVWHFAVQPIVDLHTHNGIIFSPKAVISELYRSDRGEQPNPVDNKKALKKLSWWNREWRRKMLGFVAWLSDDQISMRIPAGYQDIVVSSAPDIYDTDVTYLEKTDDVLMSELIKGI